MTNYVLIKKFCELTGYTPDSVQKLMQRSWAEGVHYRKAAGRVFISLSSFEKWVENHGA